MSATINFQGFNSYKRKMILDCTTRKVLSSQHIWCEIDNERGSIIFIICASDVPCEYQAKCIDIVMTDFCNTAGMGSVMSRCYLNHDDRLTHFVDAIKNNKNFYF